MFRVFGRVHRGQPLCYDRKIRLPLFHCDPRLQVSQHPPVLLKGSSNDFSRRRPARLGRNPHVCVAPSESRRHNSNQRSRYAVQHKRLVYNCWIGAKALYPRLVAEHEHRRSPRLVIRWLHHSPEQRRHPQKLESSRCHEVPLEALRPFSRPVQHVHLVIRNHPVKHMILFHIIQKFRADECRPPSRLAPLRIMDKYRIESLRIRVREGLHKDVVHHAENRRRRSDSQRQRKYGDHRKSWRLAKVPHGMPDVVPKRLHVHPPFTRSPLRSTPTSGARGPAYPVEAGFSPALCSGGAFNPFLLLSHLRTHPPLSSMPRNSKSYQIFETRPTKTHPSSRLPNNGYP